MRWTRLDGALMGFDRTRGLNVLYADDETRTLRRHAPRSLQVGLLTPCNLACSFCYRDTEAPSRLTRAFVVDLLQRADRWGVLEVAFGGGEPLLFKGFARMMAELHETTSLGLNFTTNGLLLTPEIMRALRGCVSEIRLSAYTDNDWRATLTRCRDEQPTGNGSGNAIAIGMNWLVTPKTVAEVGRRVREFFTLGARNVLLLGYKGADASMHLSDADIQIFRRELADLERDGLGPLLLDICMYPRLSDLPHLFARTDCGAGDDMLAITADRAVQACSFADARIPFESFEDLQRIYGMMRASKPHANVRGCTRHLFPKEDDVRERVASGRVLPIMKEGANELTPSRAHMFRWHAHASSNSGPYTLLAVFRTDADAQKADRAITDAYEKHVDRLLKMTVDEISGDAYYAASPPLQELGRAHGFEWPKDSTFVWEGDAFGKRDEADTLEIATFGRHLIVHHSYAQGIAESGIEKLCTVLGAESVIQVGEDFHVIVRPAPGDEDAEQKLSAITDAFLSDCESIDFDSDRDEDENELPFEECAYRLTLEFTDVDGARRLGFGATIGAYIEASQLVLELARIRNLRFVVKGGK